MVVRKHVRRHEKITRSKGIEVPGWAGPRPGGGYEGATKELDDAVAKSAEIMSRKYGQDVEIRFNSDRQSGGAFVITPSGLEVGLTSALRNGRVTYDAIVVTKSGNLSAASHDRIVDGRYVSFDNRQDALNWLDARVRPTRKTIQRGI